MFEFETARYYATFQSETGRNYQRKKPAMRRAFLALPQTLDDSDLDRLKESGASEVVPEIMEGSLMLASHALMLVGVPLNRVLRRIRDTREHRYSMLRGYFHGATDEAEYAAHK